MCNVGQKLFSFLAYALQCTVLDRYIESKESNNSGDDNNALKASACRLRIGFILLSKSIRREVYIMYIEYEYIYVYWCNSVVYSCAVKIGHTATGLEMFLF